MILLKTAFSVTLRFALRWSLLILEGFLCLFDELAFWVITRFKKTEYVREGQCQMTGQCCRAVGIGVPASWFRFPVLIRFLNRWYDLRYNFAPIGRLNHMMVYECRYVTSDNKCGIHPFKPALCRSFPKLTVFGKVRLHKGCGYSFRKREASAFDKVLTEVQQKEPPFDL